jgi:hypothetical protein
MLKMLAILALLLAVAHNPIKSDNGADPAKQSAEGKSSPVVSFVNNETSYPIKETTSTKPPPWYTSPEWWLCILGVPTLGFIGWQAWETRKAAEASKIAADASFAQIELMKSKERPRLSIEIQRVDLGETPVLEYKLTCHGTTPAFIKSSWQMTSFLPINDLPWVRGEYGSQIADLHDVVSNGTTEGHFFIMETDGGTAIQKAREEALHKGMTYIHFRVRITYEDIFDGRHEMLVSKVYGLPPENPLGKDVAMRPEWRDSAFKYGQDE